MATDYFPKSFSVSPEQRYTSIPSNFYVKVAFTRGRCYGFPLGIMPPKNQPKLPELHEQSQRRRIREGYVSYAQFGALLDAAAPGEERLLIKLAYVYGLRASEVGAIPLKAIDEQRGTIEIARLKKSKSGVYPLRPVILVDFKRWLRERPSSIYLFPHHLDPNSPLDKFSVYRLFRRIARAAGLPANLQHPHVLKHSIATHMLERGADLRYVQEWIGHADISNTVIYAEVTGRMKKQGEELVDTLIGEVLK